jgi:hypothetical protein
MTDAHSVCAVLNFICFLGFVTAILVITSDAPDSGHRTRRRGYAQRAVASARVTGRR